MIEKIEIAVLDRLNQAFGNTKPALGYKIEKIDSYKAELSDFGTLIKNRRTAALVACGGLSLEADYPEGSDYSFSDLSLQPQRQVKRVFNPLRRPRFGRTLPDDYRRCQALKPQ